MILLAGPNGADKSTLYQTRGNRREATGGGPRQRTHRLVGACGGE